MKTKAAVLYEMGAPKPYAASRPFVIDEIDLAAPGHGEVLVEIVGAGLCHSDLSVVDGSRPRVMPMVLGHEASGIVRELGPAVFGLKVDDKVVFSWIAVCGACEFCISGRAALCLPGAKANLAGTLLSGACRFSDRQSRTCYHHLGVSAFSQYTVAAAESLVKIDSDLPLPQAALFGCAVVTGVGAVLNTARVEAGAAAAVFGLGGVGLSALMGLRAASAYPIIAVDQVDEKLRLAGELGATHLINASNQNPVEAIRELTSGGVPYAFESVGSAAVLTQAYESTRRGGTTISIGLPSPEQMLSIPALGLVLEERTLKGSFMGSCIPQRDIPRFIAMYEAGLLPVDKLQTHTLRLEDINLGFDRLAEASAVRQVIEF